MVGGPPLRSGCAAGECAERLVADLHPQPPPLEGRRPGKDAAGPGQGARRNIPWRHRGFFSGGLLCEPLDPEFASLTSRQGRLLHGMQDRSAKACLAWSCCFGGNPS